MDVNVTGTGICKGNLYKDLSELKHSLKECVVIIGKLEISIERYRSTSDFSNVQFNNLREITDYLVIYRVEGLQSVGQLFPKLTRIRGINLFYNFGLIVHDNQNLTEIGLYSLLKIDRGGVIIWDVMHACFVDSINWNELAPNARHVIAAPERQIACRIPCSCSRNSSRNYCWNNKKCQLFTDTEKCHEQCLGCRKTRKDVCFTCRHYTYKFKCVSKCPPNTLLVPDSKYCITKKECKDIGFLLWNNTCVAECPVNFVHNNKTEEPLCEPCKHCDSNCSSLFIHTLASIQSAGRCVNVNGSLIIRLRFIPKVMRELMKYLSKIQQVTEYVVLEASDVITSLDFLSSLREIKGEKLKDGKYSIYVSHNTNLQTLFPPNVTKNLIIKNGTAHFEQNPMLCMNIIDEIKAKLPNPPGDFDIPIASNGYSGGCKEVRFNFSIRATSETSVEIKFPVYDHDTHYTALYVRVLPGTNSLVTPESCSQFEWHNADVPVISGKDLAVVELKSLQPASIYAFCIEIYDPLKNILSRSNIVNFTTPVGVPPPPFISELVASASDVIVIRWVDHRYYVDHINYYELDVMLIEMSVRGSMIDYCTYKDEFFEADDIQHALVMRPPPEYNKGCESMCGILSSVTLGALVQDYFDVCDEGHFSCDGNQENVIMQNTTWESYVQTLVLNISSSKREFQVGGLAPFRDYKFSLRACAAGQCSRSMRGVVRTLRSKNADFPLLTSAQVNVSGMILVKWKPPKVSNGPILNYYIEVVPQVDIKTLIPQSWCISAHKRETIIKTVIVSKYLVRVCLKTLASSKSCSDWLKIRAPSSATSINPLNSSITISKMDLLWIGVLFGTLVCIASITIGWISMRRIIRSDTIPLVDTTSLYAIESEPPALMLSDLVPFHTLSLE